MSNWKMLDLIVENRNSNETYPNLLDVESCSLHVVHGAFKTGMKQTGWGIDLLLKSLYSHLHETPARREDYTKMTSEVKCFLSNFVDTDGLRTKE